VAADTFFPDRPSGLGRVAWDIAQLMRDRGHKVTVFCRKQKPEDKEVSRHEDVEVVRFQFPQTFSLDPFKVQKQIRAGLHVEKKYLSGAQFDLIHIHSPIHGFIVSKCFGHQTRYVYTVHSPAVLEQQVNWKAQGLVGRIKWLGRGQFKKLEGGLLQKVDKIHTLSQFTKNAINSFYGVGSKVTVIPHWCREDFFRQYTKQEARKMLNWPEDSKILFSVRRLSPRMGLDVAIKALGPLLKAYPDVFFALVGSGPLEKSLKQLVQSLGVTNKVLFLGRVSDDTLKRCYEAADLLVLPTRELECFGLPVLESLAYGLPVISTDATALPESMEPILPECIVPAGDIGKLRQKIRAYLEERLDLPSSESLISYVKQHYGLQVIAPRIVKLLES